VQTTASEATGTIDALTPDLKAAAQHLAQLLFNTDRQVGPLTADLRTLVKSLDDLVAEAQANLFTGVGMLAPRSPLRQDTETTMGNLAAASSSLRWLATELDRKSECCNSGEVALIPCHGRPSAAQIDRKL
jgi:hypothetical protein